jgi:hypothetical protein
VLIDWTMVSFLDSAGVRLLDFIVGDLDDRGSRSSWWWANAVRHG